MIHPRVWAGMAALILSMASQLFHRSADAQTEPATKEADPAAHWIRRLADSSYDVRTQATLELCKLGPAAVPALQRAAKKSEPEVSFRAQHLLETLANLYFVGAEVTLKPSVESVAWNDAFDLVLSIRNSSAYPVRLPFLKPGTEATKSSSSAQVGAMLDMADFLVVTGPDGQPISLHVEDIRQDALVNAAVEQRLLGSLDSMLLPGESVDFQIPELNRGWARFPMLVKGKYQVQFSYVPEWDESSLTQAGIGKVEGRPCQVIVPTGAPDGILGPNGPCELTVVPAGNSLELHLRNRFDVDVHLNLNLGSSPISFSTLQLRLVCESEMESVDLAAMAGADQKFSKDRIIKLQPGESWPIARIPNAELAKKLAELAPLASNECAFQFEYVNLIDASWQRERKDPGGVDPELLKTLRSEPLPTRMLTGRVVSERVAASSLLSELARQK